MAPSVPKGGSKIATTRDEKIEIYRQVTGTIGTGLLTR